MTSGGWTRIFAGNGASILKGGRRKLQCGRLRGAYYQHGWQGEKENHYRFNHFGLLGLGLYV
jgi:hypothetical protein